MPVTTTPNAGSTSANGSDVKTRKARKKPEGNAIKFYLNDAEVSQLQTVFAENEFVRDGSFSTSDLARILLRKSLRTTT